MTDQADLARQLSRLARRVHDDKAFFSSVLDSYKESMGIDDEALAKELELAQLNIARLALCRRPNSDRPVFADQINQIAEYVGTDAHKLACIVRHVDALENLNRLPSLVTGEETPPREVDFAPGLLAAARDRSESENDNQPMDEQDD